MGTSRRWWLAASVVALSLLAASPGTAATATYRLEFTSAQRTSFLHNQGIARVPGGWILSGTDRPIPATDNLMRVNDNLKPLVVNIGAIPPQWRLRGYNHIGDIDVVGNVIYAPFEQQDYSKGVQVTAWYDARTLVFLGAIEVPQHENSFVSVDPATMIAYSMNHFNGYRILRYAINQNWKPLPPLVMSRTLRHTQGASIARGAIWISTDDTEQGYDRIFRVDLATGAVQHVGDHVKLDGEGEGIDAASVTSGVAAGDIHATILQANMRHMWVEHYKLLS